MKFWLILGSILVFAIVLTTQNSSFRRRANKFCRTYIWWIRKSFVNGLLDRNGIQEWNRLQFIFQIGLSKKCMLREETGYDYQKLIKLSDIPGIQVSLISIRILTFPLISQNFRISANRLFCEHFILCDGTAWCAYCFFTGRIAKLVKW